MYYNDHVSYYFKNILYQKTTHIVPIIKTFYFNKLHRMFRKTESRNKHKCHQRQLFQRIPSFLFYLTIDSIQDYLFIVVILCSMAGGEKGSNVTFYFRTFLIKKRFCSMKKRTSFLKNINTWYSVFIEFGKKFWSNFKKSEAMV